MNNDVINEYADKGRDGVNPSLPLFFFAQKNESKPAKGSLS